MRAMRLDDLRAAGFAEPATTGVVDLLIEDEDRTHEWADDLVAALELIVRRQVLRARCPADLRDMLECMRAGETTGRGARTEKNAIREIRAAVRLGRPRQLEMLRFDPMDPTPRPPSAAGRPRGSKTRRVERPQVGGQGVLI